MKKYTGNFSLEKIGIKGSSNLDSKTCLARAKKIRSLVKRNGNNMSEKFRFAALKNAAWYTYKAKQLQSTPKQNTGLWAVSIDHGYKVFLKKGVLLYGVTPAEFAQLEKAKKVKRAKRKSTRKKAA